MMRICAWCRKTMEGDPDRQLDTKHPVTHGICDSCRLNVKFQTGVPLSEYLDSLDAPVAVLDGNGTVVTANKTVRVVLRKTLPEIAGRPGGEVFECPYSRLPEGCGRTVHCSGCTIRRAVMATHADGQPRAMVPATLMTGEADDPQGVAMVISTERVRDMVLLRIDQVEGEPVRIDF